MPDKITAATLRRGAAYLGVYALGRALEAGELVPRCLFYQSSILERIGIPNRPKMKQKISIIAALIIIASISFTLFSCSKSGSSTPLSTQLKVKVTNNLGSPISGATVILYADSADYANKVNVVATTTTDANGYMNFSNLSTVAYYYYIQSGCLDNYHNSSNHFSTPLVANVLNTYNNIILESEGQIVIVSTSSYPYEIFLDGYVIISSLAGGQTKTISEVPAGSHSVRVLQLSGYLLTPTDETFTTNVTCGSVSTVTFP